MEISQWEIEATCTESIHFSVEEYACFYVPSLCLFLLEPHISSALTGLECDLAVALLDHYMNSICPWLEVLYGMMSALYEF